MRTISQIGSKGFTFTEILVTISILIVGVSQIFLIFFGSGAAVRHVGSRLFSTGLAENSLWEARMYAERAIPGRPYVRRQRIERGRETYDIDTTISRLRGSRGLYAVRTDVSWREDARKVSLARERIIRRR